MKSILYKVLGILLLIATILSVTLIMVICMITYLPHLIFTSCARLLHDASNLARLEEYRAKIREKNR